MQLVVNEFIRSYRMMPTSVTFEEIDIGLNLLYEYQGNVRKRSGSDYDLQIIEEYRNDANVILSRIISTIAKIRVSGKSIEQNKFEAEQAIVLDINNHDAFQYLDRMYKEQGNEKGRIANYMKWSQASKGIYPNRIYPDLALVNYYLSNKKYMDAGFQLLRIVRKANYKLLMQKTDDYVLVYNKRGLVSKVDIPCLWSLDISTYRAQACFLIVFASWATNDYKNAKRYIVIAAKWMAIRFSICKNIKKKDALNDNWGHQYYSLSSINTGIELDERFYSVQSKGIGSFEDLLDNVKDIENGYTKVFNHSLYTTCGNIINSPGFKGCLDLAHAKRLTIIILYAVLKRIIVDDWKLLEYVQKHYTQIFKEVKDEVLNKSEIINEIKALNRIISLSTSESSEDHEVLLMAMCSLIKKIYQRHNLKNGTLSILRLEAFITSIYQCTSRKEIKNKERILLSILMPVLNETAADKYAVLTDDGPMHMNDIPQLKKNINQIKLWMDIRETYCYVNGSPVKYAKREKAVLKLVLTNYNREVKLEELFKLSGLTETSNTNVNRWVSTIRKKAGWKNDEFLISGYGTGFQVKPGAKFCLIDIKS